MSYAYDEYLTEHIGNVNKGLHWMLDNLGLSQEEKSAIETAMVSFNHDESKYSTEEYNAYDQYFYGGNRSYKVVQDFNYAWLHHIHQNPHHWQYWVLLEDDPEVGLPYKTLPIPLPYIFEMIADWWSFSWKNGNLFEIFNWYAEHRDKQYIDPNSRMILERILEKIWDVLLMQEAVAGHDISEIEGQYRRFWIEQKMDQLNLEHSDEDVINRLCECGYPNVLTAQEMKSLVKHSDSEPIGKVIGTCETENGLEVTVEYSKDKQEFWKHLIEDWENDIKQSDDHLEHHGIKGQKWGVRRYQNTDGTLTEAGKERYGRQLVDTYKKLDKEYNKMNGFNLHQSPGWKKAASESTKLRHNILKSSKETMDIIKKARKLDWDKDQDKLDALRKDFKKASENTYKSILEAYGDVDVKYVPSSNTKMIDVMVDKANYDDFFDLLWADDDYLTHSDISEDDEDLYGVPELKKFPMPDKKHVKSAIRFFNYVDPKYEKELAEAILEKAEEFGMDLESDISVGDENRLKKYLPEKKEES